MEIKTAEDEVKFLEYTTLRDEARNAMRYGVYPSGLKVLAAYDALDTALAGELADEGILAYHAAVMEKVSPHIDNLRQWAAQIIGTMEAIEAAAPGTFGIAVAAPAPVEPVQPPEPPVVPEVQP